MELKRRLMGLPLPAFSETYGYDSGVLQQVCGKEDLEVLS